MVGLPLAAADAKAGSSRPVPPATREGKGLNVYQLGPVIWVCWDNRVLTAYRAHRSQKYPYMYPVTGPLSGLSLTAETAMPWPHHRSLFFACDRVNGGNYWQEDFAVGQIISDGPTATKVDETTVEIRDTCEWKKPGSAPVMRDERKITVRISDAHHYRIEWVIKWFALVDVTVERSNHSLFALRAAPDITPLGGGTLTNAQGDMGETATFGKRSEWCCFYGKRNGFTNAPVEGIAILDHPKNPWSPCQWFTRDYGFMSPTPMNFIDKPWKLSANAFVTLRYLVLALGRAPAEGFLRETYLSWAKVE
ncbi:MAG: PmoA family protein [Verrucomicrobiae bacterium]|nr:PmoA family protein [Verrucomicrobiae bacterium]